MSLSEGNCLSSSKSALEDSERAWNEEMGPCEPVATMEISLTIQKGNAADPLIRWVNDEELSLEDHLAFGRLNSWCVFDWWEPLVLLLDHPRIKPRHVEFFRLYAKE